MKTYSYSEARQKLASVLDEASSRGGVVIRRKDGRSYVLKPEKKLKSPLDVAGLRTAIRGEEIVRLIRESRKPRRD